MTDRDQFLYDIWRSCTSFRQKALICSFLLALGELSEECITENRLPNVTVHFTDRLCTDDENPIRVIQELYGAHITTSSEEETDASNDISVFEREEIRFNPESKLWEVRLWSSHPFNELYFQHLAVSEMKEFGDLFYSIWRMKSQYSIFLYFYLIQYLPKIPADKDGFSWVVPVFLLKQILRCDMQEHYREYKYFHHDVLKKAADEIKLCNELNFKYEQIKDGRNVVEIKFTVYRENEDK